MEPILWPVMATPVTEVGVPAAQRGPRPATVLVAVILQCAAIALLLAIVALAWFARAQQDGYADEAARLTGPAPGVLAAEHSSNLAMAAVISVLAGLPALWFAATVWPMLRGSNVARILAAIGAFGIPGLGLLMTLGSCLTGFLFLSMFAAGTVDDLPGEVGGSTDFPQPSAFEEKLWELQSAGPGLADFLPMIAFAMAALLAAVAVLLVVSPTNRWFSPESALRSGRPYPVYYPVYVPQPMDAPPSPYLAPPVPTPPPPADSTADPIAGPTADPTGSTER